MKRLLPEQAGKQGLGIAVVGDDDIGAHAEEALAFPRVHAAGTVVRLIAGHRHRQTASFLGVLNLDVAVAERQLGCSPLNAVLTSGCDR